MAHDCDMGCVHPNSPVYKLTELLYGDKMPNERKFMLERKPVMQPKIRFPASPAVTDPVIHNRSRKFTLWEAEEVLCSPEINGGKIKKVKPGIAKEMDI
jgi:hypothetical protein